MLSHPHCIQRNLLALVFLAAASVAGIPASLVAGNLLEMADLLAHPDRYDKQAVAVVGEVTKLQTAMNKDGQSAYGFFLKSAEGTVKVIGLGRVAVREGEQVVVEGVFNRLRQGGRAVVFNEIKADFVRPLARFTPDFVG
jgi:cytochrome c-type biogenesis protein CcmE